MIKRIWSDAKGIPRRIYDIRGTIAQIFIMAGAVVVWIFGVIYLLNYVISHKIQPFPWAFPCVAFLIFAPPISAIWFGSYLEEVYYDCKRNEKED